MHPNQGCEEMFSDKVVLKIMNIHEYVYVVFGLIGMLKPNIYWIKQKHLFFKRNI